MKHFLKVADGVDVVPLLLALQRQPQLWNRDDIRTIKGSPHAEVSDIWIRYNDNLRFKESGDWSELNNPHTSVWYPSYDLLPQIRPIAFGLMARVEGVQLGGILITRIPAGGKVLPHIDTGWHVDHFNTKLYVVLQSNPQCVNRVEDESVVMRAGEVWSFDNTKEHDVVNNGGEERITLIVCIRCDR